MKIVNTGDPTTKPSIIAMIYGNGGIGKTTFASTAPKPLLLDCENGAKYFGLRGIEVDTVQIKSWKDFEDLELIETIKTGDYETIVVDPIGEAMDKLINGLADFGNSKLVQPDGSPTMAGWGYVKKKMRNFVKFLRDSGKNIILVAHIDEKQDDEQRIVKRPMIATKISEELINMVDVVGYMTSINRDGEDVRVIIVDPGNDKMTAKDRTGQLGKYIEPDFSKIVKACQGTETYKWSKTAVLSKDKKADDKTSAKATKTATKGKKQATEQTTEELLEEFDQKVDKKIKPEDVKAKLAKAKKK